jgi:signal transduction histidine kinase
MGKGHHRIKVADPGKLRNQAEELLQSCDLSLPLPEAAANRLAHELQVHQIELELQNTELRQARDDAESALERYTELYDFAPVGYVTLDRNGMIQSLNLTGAALLGKDRGELLRRRFGLFVSLATRPLFNQFLDEVFTARRKATCEITLEMGHPLPLPIQITATATENDQECRAVFIDISERIGAADDLEQSRARLDWVLEQTGVGLWMNKLPLKGLNWDLQTRRLFHVPPDMEPTIELFWSRIHPDDHEPTRLAVEAAIRDHTLYEIDHRIINPHTGEVRWLHSAGQAIYTPTGIPILFDGINFDITERKRLEAEILTAKDQLELRVQERSVELTKTNTQLLEEIEKRNSLEETLFDSQGRLRNLSAKLQSVREEERKVVAREIHDELGQLLASIKFSLSLLAGEYSDHHNLIRRITDMEILLGNAIKTVQRISSELRPVMLDVLGLAEAIEWQAQEFQKRTNIICKCTVLLKENAVYPEAATALFRIFQESLTNVQRHSGATVVETLLVERSKHYNLIVRDNGKGITVEEIESPHSIGLIGIRERVFILGGRMKIFGSNQQGTVLFVRVPVNPKEKWHVTAQEHHHR